MYARLLTGFADGDTADEFPTRFAELLLPRIAARHPEPAART